MKNHHFPMVFQWLAICQGANKTPWEVPHRFHLPDAEPQLPWKPHATKGSTKSTTTSWGVKLKGTLGKYIFSRCVPLLVILFKVTKQWF